MKTTHKIAMTMAIAALVAHSVAASPLSLIGKTAAHLAPRQAAKAVAKESAETAAEKLAVREVGKEVGKEAVESAGEGLGKKVAGLTPKQFMGGGVGAAVAVGGPLAADNLTAQFSAEPRATAKAIREQGRAIAKMAPEYPEMVIDAYNRTTTKAMWSGMSRNFMVMLGGVLTLVVIFIFKLCRLACRKMARIRPNEVCRSAREANRFAAEMKEAANDARRCAEEAHRCAEEARCAADDALHGVRGRAEDGDKGEATAV